MHIVKRSRKLEKFKNKRFKKTIRLVMSIDFCQVLKIKSYLPS